VASCFPFVASHFLLCLVMSSCALCHMFSPSPSSLCPPYPIQPLY
jgi:hypothetical protein